MTSTVENMRYLFKGIEVDDRTREYIQKRLSQLDKFIEKILQTEVEIDFDKKGKFRVEVMIRTPKLMFRAENTTDSIEASIDLSVDELEDQIKHKKERSRTIRERGARSIKKKVVIDENARF